jgi:hypothetical protein
MIGKLLHITFIALLPLFAFSQDKISKEEIYSYWLKSKQKQMLDENYRSHFDSKIIKTIDSLKDSGVDTFGVYSVDFIKTVRLDSCEEANGKWEWAAFIQWIKNKITYHQKLTKRCQFMPIELDSSAIISFYIANKTSIDKERIMPVITGASKDKNGNIQFGYEGIANSTYHSIYCYLNGVSKFTRFDQYELDNKNNVFYLDNINSKINIWKIMILNQIKEIEK